MNEIQSILVGNIPLLITADGYRQLMVSAFPLIPAAGQPTGVKSYAQSCREVFMPTDDDCDIHITMDYDDPELPDASVAYHRVWGFITAASRWFFSTKQLEADLLAAEHNPQICAHFLHVNSPGGEAWYLDHLDQTMQQIEKPVVVLYEMACSAAYHIACHGQRVYATTRFDFVGSIGTMTSFWDFQPYYEQLGIRKVEAKADCSDLKNKMGDDLTNGHPRQYIDNVLNPLNDAFLSTVRTCRPQLAQLADDHPALRGETYFTEQAVEVGLCDGQRTFDEALHECHELGKAWQQATRQKQSLYTLL